MPSLRSPENLPKTLVKTFELSHPFKDGKTWSKQDELPKLPIPKLEDTCRRYLRALEGLQVCCSQRYERALDMVNVD